jgi:hypothetical protein
MNGLQPWLAPYASYLVGLARGRVKVTSVYRSYSDQLNLWLNRSRNPYPVAPPGRSAHNFGRAWDMTGDPQLLEQLGQIWRSWGGRWNPSDRIHFEA